MSPLAYTPNHKLDPLTCGRCGVFAGWYECLLCGNLFCKCEEALHAHEGENLTIRPPYNYTTMLQDP